MALVRQGLAETRERAHRLILAGVVTVDGQTGTRPSQPVASGASLVVAPTAEHDFVSRGALKLAAALDRWGMDPAGQVCLDVGASTGGFTDLLLRRGATRVYAVDVGYGQLHYRLRQDPRVVVMERTNARTLASLPERPSLAVVDVSFISLCLVLRPVFALLEPTAALVTLVKPQFEAGRREVGKGGVVRDPAVHRAVLTGVVDWSREWPWRVGAVMPSPLKGPAGNVEFLARWVRDGEPVSVSAIDAALGECASPVPTSAG